MKKLIFLSHFLSKLLSLPLPPPPPPSLSAPSSGIPDTTLLEIARAISGDDKITKLGIELDFKMADIDRYLRTNTKSGEITSRGNMRMLVDWRDKTGRHNQHKKLRDALTKAGLLAIAEEHLPHGGKTKLRVFKNSKKMKVKHENTFHFKGSPTIF